VSDVMPNAVSDVMSDVMPDAVSDVMSDVMPDVVPDVVSDVVSDVMPDVMSDVVSDVMPDVMSDVVSDIALQNRPANHTVSSSLNSSKQSPRHPPFNLSLPQKRGPHSSFFILHSSFFILHFFRHPLSPPVTPG
jgi:hypothetical protein